MSWVPFAVVGAAAVLLAGGAAVSRGVRVFWQGDSRWGRLLLGTGTSTLAKGGCLLTLFTMAANTLRSQNYTPDVVNELLKRGDAFSKLAGEGSLLISARAAELLGLVIGQRLVKRPVSELRALVDKALDAGGLVVLHVAHNGGKEGQHFILINGRNGRGYTAADPSPATIVQLSRDLKASVRWGDETKHYTPIGAFSLLLPGRPS